MVSVFFYGLFMDTELLTKEGFNPSKPLLACTKGYGIRIGERASLVKSENECAYEVIVSLPGAELEALYGEKIVSDYVPETLTATIAGNEVVEVTTYNLPAEKLNGRNGDYARLLAMLAGKLGLPREYIEEIERLCL